ncbi:36079_t:CDS:2 [Gigaspora margarita]|uniref:36079_t:CDS:1 n=1 Tax=Gigaspora margarita TaxID=4874 RepID=A0ABN7V6E6_GIGMA|nr:36079_t:CDS:2 [Gigaspora margarita]
MENINCLVFLIKKIIELIIKEVVNYLNVVNVNIKTLSCTITVENQISLAQNKAESIMNKRDSSESADKMCEKCNKKIGKPPELSDNVSFDIEFAYKIYEK